MWSSTFLHLCRELHHGWPLQNACDSPSTSTVLEPATSIRIRSPCEEIQRAALMASSKLRTDLDRAIGDARKGLSAAASQATAALNAVGAERRRTLLERTALAFCAAVLGGVVAGLLVHLL